MFDSSVHNLDSDFWDLGETSFCNLLISFIAYSLWWPAEEVFKISNAAVEMAWLDLAPPFLVACHEEIIILKHCLRGKKVHSLRPLPLCDYVTLAETCVHSYRYNVKEVGWDPPPP
jgi:hypothetical protein